MRSFGRLIHTHQPCSVVPKDVILRSQDFNPGKGENGEFSIIGGFFLMVEKHGTKKFNEFGK